MPLYLQQDPNKFDDLKAVSSRLKKLIKAEIKERKAEDKDQGASLTEIYAELAQLSAKMKAWSEKKSAPRPAALCTERALNGDMVLREHTGAAETITAAALNAAAAGDAMSFFQVYLEDAAGGRHVWADHEPVVSVAESVVDADVTVPGFTVENRDAPGDAPKWHKGRIRVCVTWDTDAGATKTYAPGDSIDVTVQVASDDKLLGWPVASVTKTFDVI